MNDDGSIYGDGGRVPRGFMQIKQREEAESLRRLNQADIAVDATLGHSPYSKPDHKETSNEEVRHLEDVAKGAGLNP